MFNYDNYQSNRLFHNKLDSKPIFNVQISSEHQRNCSYRQIDLHVKIQSEKQIKLFWIDSFNRLYSIVPFQFSDLLQSLISLRLKIQLNVRETIQPFNHSTIHSSIDLFINWLIYWLIGNYIPLDLSRWNHRWTECRENKIDHCQSYQSEDCKMKPK
jgi:hypothetical protein